MLAECALSKGILKYVLGLRRQHEYEINAPKRNVQEDKIHVDWSRLDWSQTGLFPYMRGR